MTNKTRLFVTSFFTLFFTFSALAAERVIDSVVATVDDKPITLIELGKRLSPPRQITVEQLRNDKTLIASLDNLILEKLLVAEAERKNIKVQDDDIVRYIEEVKKKNNLSDTEFEAAIQKEHQSLSAYKERVKSEILKSRIASASIKSTAAVTDEEVQTFIKQKIKGESVNANGQQVHLKRILFPISHYTADEARQKSEAFRDLLKSNGDFNETAEAFLKDEKDAIETDLGFVPTSDISPEIIDAVHPLTSGEVSHLVTTPEGFQVFQLVERKDSHSDTDDEDEAVQKKLDEIPADIKAQVKQRLEAEKMERKMAAFIDVELPTLHTVEKKF